jgi:hypothetical protein
LQKVVERNHGEARFRALQTQEGQERQKEVKEEKINKVTEKRKTNQKETAQFLANKLSIL